MPAAAPLQVLLFRHVEDTDVTRFDEAVVRAFQGGKEAGGYLATGEDLGIQLEVFATAPPRPPPETLDRVCHTLTLVLVDHALLKNGDGALWAWLGGCWRHVDTSGGRHGMIVLPMEERLGARFLEKDPALASLQVRPAQELGERAIRPTMLALLALHECRVLLAGVLPSAAPQPGGGLRLFISHAKIDGLPLAHSLKHQIESIPWLRGFYDAEDLPQGCNWKTELERSVGSSLIVMLRTDVYDSRYWCQQEVLWSDEYATPAVLVDARTSLSLPVSVLPFDRVPMVRIPDGNLMRVLFLALREGVRFLHFVCIVEEMKRAGEVPPGTELRVFSCAPGMSALLRACRVLSGAASPDRWILYPDPPLRAGIYEAAHALVQAYAPGVRLVTPNTLATTIGAGPATTRGAA